MKIASSNLTKIIKVCTKKEIDLIIYIGQFQDPCGVVKGIDYKDVIEKVDIKKSTFYKLLYSLEEKGIIEINYINEHGFWEVKFIDNEFKNSSDYQKGYFKLNFGMLHSKAFKQMTKGEKIVVINLLKINDFKNSMIKITFERIAEWTGKSMRSVMKFLETLSKVFNVFKIVKKGNLCLIDCLYGFGCRKESEADIRNTHLINYLLKKGRGESTDKDIKDVCTLFKQFAKLHDVKSMLQVVADVICKFGTLMPAYLNKILNV